MTFNTFDFTAGVLSAFNAALHDSALGYAQFTGNRLNSITIKKNAGGSFKLDAILFEVGNNLTVDDNITVTGYKSNVFVSGATTTFLVPGAIGTEKSVDFTGISQFGDIDEIRITIADDGSFGGLRIESITTDTAVAGVAPCSVIADGDATYSGSNGNIGQSFTACADGTLSSIQVITTQVVHSGSITVYSGDGTGGTNLGSIADISGQPWKVAGGFGASEYSTIDVSSLNISVTSGSIYTFNFSAANKLFTKATGNPYSGGQVYNSGSAVATGDFAFRANIIAAVAADTTAPVFENSTPSSSSITQTGFTLGTDIDEAGTIYYVVVANGASAPSSAEVKAGTGNGGSGQIASGNAVVSSGGFTNNFNVTSLTAGTAYDVYVVAQDDEGSPNLQASTTKIDVSTLAQPTVTLGLSGSPLAENGGVATISATLSAVSSQTVTVTIGATGTATGSGTDYNLSSTTITINAGSTTGTANITGVNDAIDESNETVIIDITGVTNGTESGTQQVTATITDDDPAPTVTLEISGSPLAENGGVTTVTATLNAVSGQTVTITIGVTGTATGSGTDYNLSSTTITINAGATTGTATITGVNDALIESNETVIIDITGVANGTESGTQQVTATIIDDDATAPTVSTTSASSIAATSATLAGNATANGGASITEKGYVYSITTYNSNPIISGTGVFKKTDGTGTGIFSESITDLIAGTQYSYKAYATNSVGTSYGTTQTLTTPLPSTFPHTITFNLGLVAGFNMSNSTSIGEFTFSFTSIDVNDFISADIGTNPNGTASGSLYDSNITPNDITKWTISKTDGTEFKLTSLVLKDSQVGASTSGTIKAFKDGNQVGATVNINFDGLKNLNANTDFQNIDQIQIEATDINFFVDDFTYAAAVASDSTAPVFENSTPSSSSVVQTGFTLGTDIDEAGTIYYVVVANDATAPSSAEVKAGTGNGGSGQITSGNAAVSTGGFTNSFSVTGLTASTAYDVYVVAQDDEGSPNLQASPTKIDVTTASLISLTITGLTGNNKVYDGTTATTASGTPSLSGVVGADDVSLVSSPVYTFASANVGTGITINTTGYTIFGTDAGKYSLTQPTLSGNITAATLTVAGLTGDNKVYNGTTAATASGTPSLSGIVNTDDVSLGGSPVYTFASANVGIGITINTTSYTISGTDSGNYSLTQPTLSANIIAATLTVTGLTGDNKVYDGTTAATASGTPSLSGIVGTDNVILGGSPVYTFASANVGTGITINTTSYTISGTDSGNYTLTQPTLSANIVAATLTVVGLTGDNKVYDGTTSVTASGTQSLSGIVGTDDVILGGSPVYTFASANVGTGITINTTSYTISGTDSGNYSLTQPTLSGNITAATLTVAGLTGDDKVYDGTTAATASGTPSLSGVVGSDDISLGGSPVYTFASANIGTGITINTTSYTISGTDSGNYSLTQPTLSANINAITPTITFNNINKTYGDGNFTLNATSNSPGAINYSVVAGGTGSAILSGTSVNVGNAGTVTIRATQAASGLYDTATKDITLTIAKKAITVTADTGQAKTSGSSNPVYTYQITSGSLVGSDAFTGALTREAGELTGSYNIQIGTLSLGNNYDITFVSNVFTINVVVTTGFVSRSSKSVIVTGQVASGIGIIERGVVYSTTDTTPEVGEPNVIKVVDDSTTGPFVVEIYGLNPSTTYYFQSYIITAVAKSTSTPTIYGGVKTFKTLVGEPNLVSKNPTNGTLKVDPTSNLTLTFDTNIKVGTGNILIKKTSDDSLIESIDITSGNITVNNSILQINPVSDLPQKTELYVLVPIGAVEDLSDNSWTGFFNKTDWTFTTDDTIDPTLTSMSPANNAVDIAVNTNIVATFNEDIKKGTGDLLIKKTSDDSIIGSLDVTSSDITISNNVVTINPSIDLPSETEMYVQVPNTAFLDLYDNSYAGISDKTTWKFTTEDNTSPTVTLSTTTNSPSNLPFTVHVTFSEAITNFDLTDITVTNGTASIFNQLNTLTYSALITPTTDGMVTVSILANKLQDTSSNSNQNTASNVLSITYDNTNPTLVITSDTTNPTNVASFVATFTFSEDMDDFDESYFTVTNGTSSNFTTVDGAVYKATITPTTDGMVTVNVNADETEDLAGNGNAAGQYSTLIDTVKPTVSITSSVTNPTNSTFTATFTFSEDVSNFVIGDITLANATASNFTATSNSVYTALITPTTDGNVTIDIAADVANDAATNGNTAATQFSTLYDATKPTITITSSVADPTNSTFTATFTFSEDVSNFVIGDITLVNATASNFIATSNSVYTALITPTTDGSVTIDVAADVANDAATNGNTAATQFSVLYDVILPTVSITSPITNPTNSEFTATFTFSEDVSSFVIGDITLANATASNFTATSSAVYTALITPTTDGSVTIDIAADVANDAATNGNTAAAQFSTLYDATRPTVNITSSVANPTNSAFTATITFSEDVLGFDISDIDVGNGTASNLMGSGAVYTATITPTTDGGVIVFIPENVVEDSATNKNEISNEYFVAYDATNPTVTITSSVTNPTNSAFTTTFTFSEDVSNFVIGDITLANATASNFTATSSAVYTALITPTTDGNVTIDVAADVANDAATNGNTAANQFSTLYDATKPVMPVVVAIDDYRCSVDTKSTADNTLIFNGTAEANSTIEVFVNATSVGNTTANTSGEWIFDYTSVVLAEGTYSVTATATDAATNVSDLSSVFSIKVDKSLCQDTIVMKKKYGFSPNGDGVNDTWVIEDIELFPNNVVNIYNRSGKLVFTMKGYNNTFNGFSNKINSGKKLPVGAYYFTVEFNTPGAKPAKGWIYINY